MMAEIAKLCAGSRPCDFGAWETIVAVAKTDVMLRVVEVEDALRPWGLEIGIGPAAEERVWITLIELEEDKNWHVAPFTRYEFLPQGTRIAARYWSERPGPVTLVFEQVPRR